MKFKVYKDVPRYVYTLEEFYIKHPGVEPIHWREAKKGDWALTDDGGVCEVLARSSCRGLSGMKQTFVKTATGSYITEGNVSMDSIIKHDLSRIVPMHGKGAEIPSYTTRLRRDKASKGDLLFSQHLMTRKQDETVEDAYAKAFPRAKSPAYIKIMAARLYKTQRIQKLLKQQILDGLTAKDVTFSTLVDGMKKIMDNWDVTKQGSLVVPAATKLETIKQVLSLMGVTTEKRLIEDTTWHAKGVIGEGERKEVREIGQSAKKTQITQDVGTD